MHTRQFKKKKKHFSIVNFWEKKISSKFYVWIFWWIIFIVAECLEKLVSNTKLENYYLEWSYDTIHIYKLFRFAFKTGKEHSLQMFKMSLKRAYSFHSFSREKEIWFSTWIFGRKERETHHFSGDEGIFHECLPRSSFGYIIEGISRF